MARRPENQMLINRKKKRTSPAHSAGAVDYTDCISAEGVGKSTTPAAANVLDIKQNHLMVRL